MRRGFWSSLLYSGLKIELSVRYRGLRSQRLGKNKGDADCPHFWKEEEAFPVVSCQAGEALWMIIGVLYKLHRIGMCKMTVRCVYPCQLNVLGSNGTVLLFFRNRMGECAAKGRWGSLWCHRNIRCRHDC